MPELLRRLILQSIHDSLYSKMIMDITKLSIENLTEFASKDLISLIGNATKALEFRKETERVELARKLQNLAAESGFSLEELAAIKLKVPKSKMKKGAPKFRNPNDATQTWTGKGIKPKWFKALLDSGKTEDELRI